MKTYEWILLATATAIAAALLLLLFPFETTAGMFLVVILFSAIAATQDILVYRHEQRMREREVRIMRIREL